MNRYNIVKQNFMILRCINFFPHTEQPEVTGANRGKTFKLHTETLYQCAAFYHLAQKNSISMQILGCEQNVNSYAYYKIIYLVSPSSTDRPSGFATATNTATATATPPTASATTRSAASTAWTAQVSKVYLQLGRDVISWLPEMMHVLQLNFKKQLVKK